MKQAKTTLRIERIPRFTKPWCRRPFHRHPRRMVLQTEDEDASSPCGASASVGDLPLVPARPPGLQLVIAYWRQFLSWPISLSSLLKIFHDKGHWSVDPLIHGYPVIITLFDLSFAWCLCYSDSLLYRMFGGYQKHIPSECRNFFLQNASDKQGCIFTILEHHHSLQNLRRLTSKLTEPTAISF